MWAGVILHVAHGQSEARRQGDSRPAGSGVSLWSCLVHEGSIRLMGITTAGHAPPKIWDRWLRLQLAVLRLMD